MVTRTKATLVKYLVVSPLSNLNKREIKRLTNSSVADALKISQRDYYNWPSSLHHTILRALAVRGGDVRHRELKIYELDDNAVSTMYALQDTHFIAALSLSEDIVDKLDRLLDAKYGIERMNSMLDNLIHHQNTAVIGNLKFVGMTLSNSDKFEDAIRNVSEKYAQVEYEAVINEVNEIMKSSW